jgi:hypothetical protein
VQEGRAAPTVIFQNEKGFGDTFDRPDLPYATINILDAESLECEPDEEYNTATETFTYDEKKTFLASVNAYAEQGAMQIIGKICRAIRMPEGREMLVNSGLFWRETGKIQDLTELLDTGHEKRAQVDIVFAYAEESKSSGIVNIERVTGTASIGIERNFDTDNE